MRLPGFRQRRAFSRNTLNRNVFIYTSERKENVLNKFREVSSGVCRGNV